MASWRLRVDVYTRLGGYVLPLFSDLIRPDGGDYQLRVMTMSAGLVLLLIIVAIVCLFIGGWTAETMRGLHDARNIWRRRKNYRK